MQTKEFTVEETHTGTRLDVFLAAVMEGISRSHAEKLCTAGNVLVNGKIADKKLKLNMGNSVTVTLPQPKPLQAVAQDIPLDIVYEDEHVLVLNKPQGMVVHPGAGNEDGTVVNALLHHCQGNLSSINGVMRPGIVHRIDKDTSGLLVTAKTDVAHAGLSAQLAEHSCRRIYHAVVVGSFKEAQGTINRSIGRHPVNRKMMTVGAKHSRDAVTHYHTLACYKGYSHIQVELETGRTHQIRVHMAAAGHPIAGDPVYGKPLPALKGGQCLHAKELMFTHPVTGAQMHFETPLPTYFVNFLNKLEEK